MEATITEESKKKLVLCIKTSTLQAKFEYDIVETAAHLGLDPLEALENVVEAMNNMKENGIFENHVAEILEEIESKQDEGREAGKEETDIYQHFWRQWRS